MISSIGQIKPIKNLVIVLTYPQTEFRSSGTDERIPFTGSIDQIGSDVEKVKEMGIDHIIFCYLFSIENKNTGKIVHLMKELSEFTR
jgi:hypothetical protein